MKHYSIDTVEHEEGYVQKFYNFTAVCTSDGCRHAAMRGNDGAVKAVAKTQNECPDCGYFLLWKKQEI